MFFGCCSNLNSTQHWVSHTRTKLHTEALHHPKSSQKDVSKNIDYFGPFLQQFLNLRRRNQEVVTLKKTFGEPDRSCRVANWPRQSTYPILFPGYPTGGIGWGSDQEIWRATSTKSFPMFGGGFDVSGQIRDANPTFDEESIV